MAFKDGFKKLADDDGGAGLGTAAAVGAAGYGGYRAGKGLARVAQHEKFKKGFAKSMQSAQAGENAFGTLVRRSGRIAKALKK